MRTEWEIRAFDACVEKQKAPTKLLSSSYQEKGAYPIVSQEKDLISGYWDNRDDLFVHRKPVVVFGDHTMVVKYIDFDFVVGADGVKILEPKDFLLPKFFFYWVSSVRIKSRGYARHFRYLREANVPVPSLPEQQRVVDILDQEFAKIDALKANAEKSLQAAKDLFQATLKKELEPKEGWETKHLNEWATYSIGLTYKPADVSNEGTIVLRSSNIQNDELVFDDIVRVSCKVKDELFVENGDILMCSRNGSARLVGKVARICKGQERMTYGTFMTIIRSEFNPILFYYFKSNDFRSQISKGENTMINQITKYMLNDVVVSLPNDPGEISRIARSLDNLNDRCKSLQENYQKTLTLCDDLKQSLLRKAFNGEL